MESAVREVVGIIFILLQWREGSYLWPVAVAACARFHVFAMLEQIRRMVE